MLKTELYQYTTVDDFTGLLSLTKTTNPTPADNEWCFNASKELHIKDASASLFGAFAKNIYGLVIGDIIEISCEAFPISGVKPKISIDGRGGEGGNINLVDTSGYDYPANVWKPLNLKYIVQKNHDFCIVNIGSFTADIAEYKLRNITITIQTQTIGTAWYNKKVDERMFAIKKVSGLWTIDSTYSSDTGTITVINNLTHTINFTKQFSSKLIPIPSVCQDYGSGTYEFRIGSVTKSVACFRAFNTSGTMVDLTTIADGTMFFVTLRGYI